MFSILQRWIPPTVTLSRPRITTALCFFEDCDLVNVITDGISNLILKSKN